MREEKEKRNDTLVDASETSGELAEWRRLQRKNLSIQGMPKRKEWPKCHKVSSWQELQSRLCKKKGNRTIRSDNQIVRLERVKVSESRTLERKRKSEREQREEKENFKVKESRFQGEEGGHAMRAFQGEIGWSMSE